MDARVFEFGPFRFDSGRGVLWRGDSPMKVVPKALDVLGILLANAGQVVSKTELLQKAWPDVAVEEANLSVNVSILRRALQERPDGGPWIETVARRGYRFAFPVAEARPTRPRSLGVLPFRALGQADDEGALGLAMADALITRLAAGARLDVRPTSAIQRYAHLTVPPYEAGRALEVEAVLEGHLQRAGSRLRVTAQLLSVSSKTPLWADQFEADFTDLFAVQDAVAERLAEALALEMHAEPKAPSGARQTRSVPAYEACARGRFFWSRFSRTWLEKAVAAFHEAVELDPAYAAPHAGLADACLASGFAGVLPPREAWDLASAEASRALALDERLCEAWISQGFVSLLRDWDWTRAESAFRQAVARDPGSAAAHLWLGLFLALCGRASDASAPIARARALDPLSVIGFALEGFRLALSGDHDGALIQQRRSVDLDPHQFLGHWALGTALQNVGRFEEAVAEHRLALDLSEGATLMRPVLARSLALAGQPDQARALLADPAGAPDPSEHVSPYQEATVHLALREPEAAVEKLRAACDARDPWCILLPTDPMLASLHADQTWRALARRVRDAATAGLETGAPE